MNAVLWISSIVFQEETFFMIRVVRKTHAGDFADVKIDNMGKIAVDLHK